MNPVTASSGAELPFGLKAAALPLSPGPFALAIAVRWADLDPNGHVRHSAYLDYAAQIRIAYFASCGFDLKTLAARRIGPILFSETIHYRRELRDNETVTADLWLRGLSVNGKHWRIAHRLFKADGALAAELDCRGAWLDLAARRVAVPPADLLAALAAVPRSADFAPL